MSIISSVINNTELITDLSDENLIDLYKLANKHDLAHIVGFALQKNGLFPNNKIGEKFESSIYKAVFRYEKLKYELNNICSVLEEAEIAFIPLKGSVLRDYYPEPWMRTSCDIDIYVDKNNLEKAIAVLKDKLNYNSNFFGPHDVSLFSKTNIHIELHYNLIDETLLEKADKILSDVWSRAALKDKTNHQYLMTDEMFYFYHLAHMAKHFKNGGCGIRSFLDIFVLNSKVENNKEKRDALLLKGGLLSFASIAEKTADVWFNGSETDDTVALMSEYIISGGMYGSSANKSAIDNVTEKKTKYLSLKKLWKPYNELKYWYPSLEKRKYLLPFYEVKRWCRLLLGGTIGRVFKLKKNYSDIEKKKLDNTKKLYRILDLD